MFSSKNCFKPISHDAEESQEVCSELPMGSVSNNGIFCFMFENRDFVCICTNVQNKFMKINPIPVGLLWFRVKTMLQNKGKMAGRYKFDAHPTGIGLILIHFVNSCNCYLVHLARAIFSLFDVWDMVFTLNLRMPGWIGLIADQSELLGNQREIYVFKE